MSANTADIAETYQQSGGAGDPSYVADRLNDIKSKRREEAVDAVELRGNARDLFERRHEDTFDVDVHGEAVEFYRPMAARGVDLSTLARETRDRVKRGAALLDEYEARQRELMQRVESPDSTISELLDESQGGVDLMAQILATHAVDDSLQSAATWRAIYRNEDKLGEVFEDFIAEGDRQSQQQKLAVLESLTSGNSSTN